MRQIKRLLVPVLALIALAAIPSPALGQGTPAPFTSCVNETRWDLPTPGIGFQVRNDLRHIDVSGSVTGLFEGTCRGFATVRARITVRRDNGNRKHKLSFYLNQEFKNGWRDTGGPFEFAFRKRFRKLKAGDCVRAKTRVTWMFQNNEPVPDSLRKAKTDFGCVA